VARIPESTIQEIRERIDIVDLVGRYLSLRPSGRNFVGLCPFHTEKTPSFNVNRERQIWHCFGCGEGGHVFTFLMRHENLTFPEAVRQLARECGVEVPEEGGAEHGSIEAMVAANDAAQALYRKALASDEGAEARAYLCEERGLDSAVIERFGIGFAPDRWDAVVHQLRVLRIPFEAGERAGLIAKRQAGDGHYDRLRGRVTFPIQDVRGRVIGFGGRALAKGQEPKYLNTPETAIFRKREAFFGFPRALEAMRKTGRAVVVEGYFDLVALDRAGIAETVATCGTALTTEHAKNLRRRAREVVLLFDGDVAGEKAVRRALEVLLPEGLRVRAARLPGGDDPDTYLAREGARALAALVDASPPAIELVIRSAAAEGVATPSQKADAVASVAPLLVLVGDPVERGEWARRLALATYTETRHVELALRQAAQGKTIAATPEALPHAAPRREGPEDRFARDVARLLLRHPSLSLRVPEGELVSELPEGKWRDLVAQILESVRAGAAPDPAVLCEGLVGDARGALLALAVDDAPDLEETVAASVLDQTLARLRERRLNEEQRALTRRLEDSSPDDARALLAAKQRRLDERRAARLAVGSGRPPVSPPPEGRR
jgi:DNA primase